MSVSVSTLSNGLRVVSDSIKSVETVTLGVWINVGSRFEKLEVNGISHMLEHMAFKGTKTRSAREIAEEIENVGGFLNAYTSREMTAYYAKTLKEDAPLALEVLADILQNSVFDEKELAREKDVIVQEIYQTFDTPDDIIYDYFQDTAFPKQAVGMPILGTEKIVRGISRSTLIDFMKHSYTAPRIIVAATGNIEHEALVEMAEKAFTDIPDGNEIIKEATDYKGGNFREQRKLEQIHVLIGFNGISYNDDDYFTASALSMILGGGMSSRLFQEIREKRGLAYSTHAFSSSYSDGGLFGVYAGTGEKEINELIPVMCDEVLKVAINISEEETKRACTQLKAAFLMSLENTSTRCEQIVKQLFVYGKVLPIPELLEKLEKINTDNIHNVAKRIFTSNPTFTTIGQINKVESFDSITKRLKI
ncbi:MAG: insulinase family protein [Alphaproteobacteria bacterium]|nr:insulinase family protein [Alphaproteobacteria bacterium]